MVLTQKLTPETFLSAPRRGPAIPNHNGSLALHTVSTHTFGEDTLKEVRVMDLGSGISWQLSADEKVHDPNWVPGDTSDAIIWLRSADKGVTEVVVAHWRDSVDGGKTESYLAAEIDGPVKHLKLKRLDDGSVAFAVVGLVDEDGSLYNGETAEKKPSTARIYDSIQVREWDNYVKPQKYAIWFSKLVCEDDKWKLASSLENVVRDTDIEAPENMYEPGDPASGIDIGQKGIVFVARDPHPTDAAYSAASDVYFVPLEDFALPALYKPTRIQIQSDHAAGMAANPRFSPDGTMIAYLKSPFACPADTRLLMGHVGSGAAFDVFKMVIGKAWDLVPESFEYAPSGHSLFVVAQDCGRKALFELDLGHHAVPRTLMRRGSVSAFYPVGDGGGGNIQLLTSSSSFVESSVYHVVDTSMQFEPRVVSAASRHGAKFGLSHSQVSELWFEGGGDYCVQAWVIRPKNFDESKKYPFVLMIHGGPESAWCDEWHPRWNPAVWAEQGYVIVCPNPSGSTGFGVPFQKGVYDNWGGRPYEDLVNCMEYLKNLPYLDMDRAIAAGGSYGGYMVNWINGHPLARKFKATICHDSVFSLPNFLLVSDIVAGTEEFGGPGFPWANWHNLYKWSPARPELLRNWKHAPPSLVVHSDNDFRCPVTEGLAAFRTLQCHGVPSRFLSFPDENHFVLKPENSLTWHHAVFEWMEKWVGKNGDGSANEAEPADRDRD